ncbi:MAG: hypothetical protein HQ581_29485, partial [Planctomycetes bacterium]|nr:hypothetical protein [Planctomycetota bacterium]
MSNDENRPAMDEPADAVRDDAVRDLVPRPVLAAQPMSPWLEETGFGPPAPSGGAGISTYLHALRRRWLVAAVLGVICCGIAFAAVQYTAKDQYTATALIRVVSEDKLVFDVNRGDAASIDTLQQYLQQRYVLEAAIRQVKLAMKEAKEGDDVTKVRLLEEIDPAAVLGKVLKTDCPGKAEILRIRLTRDIREESAILVNAVLDAFIEEVVSAESGRMRERLGE